MPNSRGQESSSLRAQRQDGRGSAARTVGRWSNYASTPPDRLWAIDQHRIHLGGPFSQRCHCPIFWGVPPGIKPLSGWELNDDHLRRRPITSNATRAHISSQVSSSEPFHHSRDLATILTIHLPVPDLPGLDDHVNGHGIGLACFFIHFSVSRSILDPPRSPPEPLTAARKCSPPVHPIHSAPS